MRRMARGRCSSRIRGCYAVYARPAEAGLWAELRCVILHLCSDVSSNAWLHGASVFFTARTCAPACGQSKVDLARGM